MGSGILARAAVQAYRQALASKFVIPLLLLHAFTLLEKYLLTFIDRDEDIVFRTGVL